MPTDLTTKRSPALPADVVTKRLSAPLTLLGDAAPEGTIQAAFSVLDEVDLDGDIVLASAFTPGQEVPMVWSHDWRTMPVGKGAIRLAGNRAILDGRFFTETSAGRDAYLTVKAMEGLQEWSFGFRVLDAEPTTVDGKGVRLIKRAEIFEVSPVLLGANRNTETVAIKSGEAPTNAEPAATPDPGAVEQKDASLEAVLGAVQAALFDRFGSPALDCSSDECAWVVATYPERVVFCRHGDYWQLAYTTDADGDVTLSGAAPTEVEQTYLPVVEPAAADEAMAMAPSGMQRQSYATHAARVLHSVEDLATRSRSLADLRKKSGRTLSGANRDRLASVREQILAACDDLERLLGETEPPDAGDAASAAPKGLAADAAALKVENRRLFLEFQRSLAQFNGAAVTFPA